jgi:hypothetical protein
MNREYENDTDQESPEDFSNEKSNIRYNYLERNAKRVYDNDRE